MNSQVTTDMFIKCIVYQLVVSYVYENDRLGDVPIMFCMSGWRYVNRGYITRSM